VESVELSVGKVGELCWQAGTFKVVAPACVG
jgi:hypothetical protein